MSRAIERRLEKLEGSMGSEKAPTCIVPARPLKEGEAPKLLATWREEVASGRASVSGNALFVRGEQFRTAEEWLAAVRRERWDR